MQKFYVDECPRELPVGDWIKQQLPWEEAKQDVWSSSFFSKYMHVEFNFTGDVPALQQSVKDALDIYGFHGWRTAEGEGRLYGGYSITYNPDLQYVDQPIHQHTLGTKLNSMTAGDFYAGSSVNHEYLKNSYLDGMSFNVLTPAARVGYMGQLLQEINNNVTITRSRLAIVRGSEVSTSMNYHIDSEIFELVRLNIPVTSNEHFLFEFEEQEGYPLELGKAYSWQTELPHRVYCIKENNIDRANMVIGLSPWLTYNREERYWYPNEFFGKKHPFDVLIDGHVTDKIELLKVW